MTNESNKIKIDTVLFDYDGTLMDTGGAISKTWRYIFERYTGKEVSDEFLYKNFGEPVSITVEKLFPNMDHKQIVEDFREYQKGLYFLEIRLFPGMVELLKQLKEKSFKIGLVTSRLRKSLEVGLNKYEILPLFDSIITPEKTDSIKPEPEPFLLALWELDSTPAQSIMVGDSKFDIQGARNAGITSVLVDWSDALPRAERVGLNTPDHTIADAAEIWDIIKGA
jgi:pyrophosphatase PpaX